MSSHLKQILRTAGVHKQGEHAMSLRHLPTALSSDGESPAFTARA